ALVVPDRTGSPVDADDLLRDTPHEHRGVTGDREPVGAADRQSGDGGTRVDPIGADAPELVVGADPPTPRSRAWLLDDDLARVGVVRERDPVTVAEPDAAALGVEHEWCGADQGEARR